MSLYDLFFVLYMKLIYNFIFLLIFSITIPSCVTDNLIEVNPDFMLSFQRTNVNRAYVGTNFYVIRKGTGQFFTLYDGSPGHVWGEQDATGVFFNNADSLPVNYSQPGKYQLTVVASSAENFGSKLLRQIKTVEINTIDDRNSIVEFYFADNTGKILYTGKIVEDSINVPVPNILTNLNFYPIFVLSSNLAKVYVNDIVQSSGANINSFAQDLDYKVVADDGNSKIYHVKAKKYQASSDKNITKFSLGAYNAAIAYKNSFGETAAIDVNDSTLSLSLNYGTLRTSVQLIIESSFGSSIFIDGLAYNPSKKNYNLNTITQITVVAQNGTQKNYSLNLADQNPFQTFTFAGLVPSPIGIIDNTAHTITLNVLNGTNLKNLAALWTGTSGKVMVGSIIQTNGSTTNDFSSPVSFSLYKGTTLSSTYQIIVNVK